MDQLCKEGMNELPVIAGGIIPPQDEERLLEMGCQTGVSRFPG